MTDQILFNKLSFIDRLRRAGIADDQARAHAEAFDDALREAVATKTDVAGVKSELLLAIAQLEHRLTLRTGGMVAAGVGILISIKYFG